VTADTTPTLASLAQSRARQRAILRVLRPLAIGVVVLVAAVGSRNGPRPGLSGDHLGVLLALLGFAVGIWGVMRGRRSGAASQAPFLVLLLGSAAALVWLQPHGPGFVGALVAVGVAAMRVHDLVGAAAFLVALAALAAAGTWSGGESWTSLLLTELGIVAIFVIARLSSRLREGQEQAERLLLELDRNREAQAQAAVLAERQRLAREMHDVLAHSLAGLVLQLEGARLLAEQDEAPPRLTGAVERAQRLARTGLDEARRAIETLRDEELPGPERLPALAREFEDDSDVRCETVITGSARSLSAQQRLTIYRVAQEALTNIRKHAAPDHVELRLDYEPAGVRLTVEDSGGHGRTAPAAGGGGYGLAGMRERADLLRGTFTARPTVNGFRVELWLPV
jgi:signal transduction histidine kinase